MNLSIVIPAYNESGNIGITLSEILENTGKIRDIEDIRIIVVDDHSSDSTYETVVKTANPDISCIRLSRRSGSHVALRAGIREASGDAVLCISADGQDDPAALAGMIERLKKGAGIVWAVRKDRRNEPFYMRKSAELFYKTLFWLLRGRGNGVDMSRADFFIFNRAVADAVNSCQERNTSLFGLLAWLGFRQESVEYERRCRRLGRSKWNIRSRFHLAKDWIIAFSGLPLKIASFLGISIAILGALGAVYVIVNKLVLRNEIVTGWTSIMVLLLLLGGIQLTILGVVGEYLWRNLDESRKRPLFFIEKRSGT